LGTRLSYGSSLCPLKGQYSARHIVGPKIFVNFYAITICLHVINPILTSLPYADILISLPDI
jgi:hypothetical protein